MPVRLAAVASGVAVALAMSTVGLAGPIQRLAGPAPADLPLFAEGLVVGADGLARKLPAGSLGTYVPGSSVLVGTGGAAQVRRSSDWLAAGVVPTGPYADMATRALLDLHALRQPDGSVVAALSRHWRYVWPRDTAFVAAAFSVTGHRDDAYAALRALLPATPADGVWQARYLPDGSGAVPDDRGVQRDGAGWLPWAVWVWYVTGEQDARDDARLARLWPLVRASADGSATSLGGTGLPPASSDYQERDEDDLTLGVAAPVLTGLRAATDLARDTGRAAQARRWAEAAGRLDTALVQRFGAAGWPRTADTVTPDAAVTFVGPPYQHATPSRTRALRAQLGALSLPGGGVRLSPADADAQIAWTPETALFGLAFAASGDSSRADAVLTWLDAHRTGLGALPEKVRLDGRPASVAPLAWTCALVLLTVVALDEGLPVPPDVA